MTAVLFADQPVKTHTTPAQLPKHLRVGRVLGAHALTQISQVTALIPACSSAQLQSLARWD